MSKNCENQGNILIMLTLQNMAESFTALSYMTFTLVWWVRPQLTLADLEGPDDLVGLGQICLYYMEFLSRILEQDNNARVDKCISVQSQCYCDTTYLLKGSQSPTLSSLYRKHICGIWLRSLLLCWNLVNCQKGTLAGPELGEGLPEIIIDSRQGNTRSDSANPC